MHSPLPHELLSFLALVDFPLFRHSLLQHLREMFDILHLLEIFEVLALLSCESGVLVNFERSSHLLDAAPFPLLLVWLLFFLTHLIK